MFTSEYSGALDATNPASACSVVQKRLMAWIVVVNSLALQMQSWLMFTAKKIQQILQDLQALQSLFVSALGGSSA
eukprot:954431-Amphidinium_carterae.1